MQVSIRLEGDAAGQTWTFTQGSVRIGRDPGCELPLPENAYAMVSRHHATLTIEPGRVLFTDAGSANGVLRNGVRERSGELHDRDVLQLGPAGPKFSIHFSAAAQSTVVAGAPTLSSQRPDDRTHVVLPPTQTAAAPSAAHSGDETNVIAPATRATQQTPVGHQPTSVGSPQATITAGRVPASAQGAMPSFGLPVTPAAEETVPKPKSDPKGSPMSGVAPELLIAMEKKLKALYTLTLTLVGLMVILVGFAFYESQQIEKNRQQLIELEAQADDQIQKLAPQLKTRLDSFDQQVNSVDSRMKAAQDQFEQRMKTQLPALMDAYIAKKTKEIETKGLNGLTK